MASAEEACAELVRSIELCSLPRLPGDCDGGDYETHYRSYAGSLRGRIGALRRRLAADDLGRYSQDARVDVVSRILILIYELRSKGPWSPEGFNSFAASIEESFTGTTSVSLGRFAQDAGGYRQSIFDSYFANLHKKLTPMDWKKYPATIEAYCYFSSQFREYIQHGIEIDPVKVLPASLLFIDDFNNVYKHKGLDVLLNTLDCLTKESFRKSNYQQVIYNSLAKVMRDSDIEILKLTYQCMEKLTSLLALEHDSQFNQFDVLIKDLIEGIYVATNLERKSLSFEFLSKLICLHKSECVTHKKRFHNILTDNLELCSAENVRRVMLHNILLAMKTWLQHCWIVWKYPTDKGILTLLFKLLYIQCNEKVSKKTLLELEDIIVCIIMLCTKEERDKILISLNDHEPVLVNQTYIDSIKHISRVCKETSTTITKTGKKRAMVK